jgi:NAD(P)H-dependent FMN reductase
MKIQLIIGSTRPNRLGPQIADWMIEHMPQEPSVEYEKIDLVGYDLPLFNEPTHPVHNNYTYEHSMNWSQKILEGNAFIFLTPEYNAGYPAALKNAIDYLFHEWRNKPVMIASYGAKGGLSASAQLRAVAQRLAMRPTATSPAFTVLREAGESGQIKDIAASFAPYEADLEVAGQELIELVASQQVQPV